jgi:hypothetical protein
MESDGYRSWRSSFLYLAEHAERDELISKP